MASLRGIELELLIVFYWSKFVDDNPRKELLEVFYQKHAISSIWYVSTHQNFLKLLEPLTGVALLSDGEFVPHFSPALHACGIETICSCGRPMNQSPQYCTHCTT